MKVYLLTRSSDYDDFEILSVHSTKTLAESTEKKHIEKTGLKYECEIDAYELDTGER